MKRQIITIDQDKCTGCGLCIPNCPEGAIQMIDGKARVVNLSLCDGLGACIGHCPEEAIATEVRDAAEYDEAAVLKNIIPQGENTLRAHLVHLRDHGQTDLLEEAEAYLAQHGIEVSLDEPAAVGAHEHAGSHAHGRHHAGCPGAQSRSFDAEAVPAPGAAGGNGDSQPSALTHWPIQLHLISPAAPQFRKRDLLLAADCTAFSMGAFHAGLLHGRTLAIACPKLDEGQETYVHKLTALIDSAEVNTITVATMEVPCCSGLLATTERAARAARRKVPIKHVIVGVQGELKGERWV
jgi:NAD-dependent dihydropyrimidine dehydrogenase PreA subunit